MCAKLRLPQRCGKRRDCHADYKNVREANCISRTTAGQRGDRVCAGFRAYRRRKPGRERVLADGVGGTAVVDVGVRRRAQ